MIDGRGGIAIAEIIFYVIGLAPAIYVCTRHGFGRHGGWFYLLSLPIVRIVGASCELAAEQKPSVGLYTAAAICNGIGLVPLLLVVMAVLKRANDGMSTRIPVRVFQLSHLVIIIGLALTIAGSVEAIPTNSASEISSGRTLRKAGIILLLIAFIANAAITAFTLFRIRQAWAGDRKLVYAVALSLPFLLVRVIYSVCIAFATHSKTFNAQAPNVFVQAFMQVLMEFIIWTILLVGGLLSPSTKEAPYSHGSGIEILPGRNSNKTVPAYQPSYRQEEMGTAPARR